MTPAEPAPPDAAAAAFDLLNGYSIVFVAAFLVTLLATPLVRLLAVRANIVDRPDTARKGHAYPVASLGGTAVYLGLLAAIALSYVVSIDAPSYRAVPLAVVLGMTAIMVTGLADDVWGLGPRLKIAGQLVAAAALAIENVGVRAAAGLLRPAEAWLDPILGTEHLVFVGAPQPWGDLVYWAGTALIAIFVIGGCNAANLIDGLDGLLSGAVAIMTAGFLAISVLMILLDSAGEDATESLAAARIVLCLAMLGAVLGFLPHNFNPASIFLGDCGSLLLGYVCVVVILMFGEPGQAHLVFAGLIIFSVPIMDTILAMIRRWLAGTPLSAADDQHIHHQLKRSLGGVKGAVFAMYGVTLAFALLGVALAALVMATGLRVRVVYAIALVLFGFIGAVAVKTARRKRILADAESRKA
jgi:UDP-GlcNAc:undecaprenyl-phosphate GlcNAc-1-phosphate transferase